MRRSTRVALALAGALVVAGPAANAQPTRVRVTLRPPIAELGQRVAYRVEVTTWYGASVRWFPPDSSEALTWGVPKSGRIRGHFTERQRYGKASRGPRAGPIGQMPDTFWVEMLLQAFRLGEVAVPGLRFDRTEPWTSPKPASERAPATRLIVVPVLTAADSNATLRPLRGPLAAPWWERVPWILVIAGLLALVGTVLLVRWLRQRRPALAPATAAPEIPPAAAALAALSALRAQQLPEQARFGEHAFQLGQILRRYLEATVRTTRPGDTTSELVGHLREAGLEAADLQRLAALLRVWDRIKFAREAATREEAVRMESAVEGFVRRGTAIPVELSGRKVA